MKEVAELVLQDHFPEMIHEDILMAVGLDLDVKLKRSRDPRFREKILRAYEYSCAICGFNVRLGNHLVGVKQLISSGTKWAGLIPKKTGSHTAPCVINYLIAAYSRSTHPGN